MTMVRSSFFPGRGKENRPSLPDLALQQLLPRTIQNLDAPILHRFAVWEITLGINRAVFHIGKDVDLMGHSRYRDKEEQNQ